VNSNSNAQYPQVLLLASRYDLTCDYIVSRLRGRSISYFRLNTEDLGSSRIELDPARRILIVDQNSQRYIVTPEHLRSVLFRRPVFLRDYGESSLSPVDQFARIQWTTFVRNLMLFKEAFWVNDPTATYRAEHKAVQLSVAVDVGFTVPETRVSNSPHPHLLGDHHKDVAIKGLDTVLMRSNDLEMFGFTTFENTKNLEPYAWRTAPATFQAALTNKLDIRVTVVEEYVFAAAITVEGKPVSDDWRLHKRETQFSRLDLPEEIVSRCRTFVKELGLVFGAIDLALCDNEYYFLEINPTGEWAWLVEAARLPIDDAIVESLLKVVLSNGQ